MSRRVRRKTKRSNFVVDESINRRGFVDWISLPDDTVVQLFSCLNFRDRASLSSTCRNYKDLGCTDCLWNALDVRFQKFDAATAACLASRCSKLEKIRFRGAEAASAIMNLRARGLREISGDFCREITDSTLSVMVARHEALECLQLGPDFCERISTDAVKSIGICCPKLKKLRLSGVQDIDGDAISTLGKNCTQLEEVGFMDCLNVDEEALGDLVSVRFLSLAGTRNINWSLASEILEKLPNLIAIDVSRTDINSSAVIKILSSTNKLKVLCALNCSVLETEGNLAAYNTGDKLFLAFFKDTFKEVASLFADNARDNTKDRMVFSDWRNGKIGDKSLNAIMTWLEWILSHSLLRIAESNPHGLDEFWLSQGAALLLRLVQSSQEDVQERAATGLATFVVIDDENATVDCKRAEAVMSDGGIRLLLDLARSCREGLQSEAAKAIANLSVNADVAKSVAEEGGINILSNLARSLNRLVAEEAAGGLWNLSVGEEHKGAIAKAGGIKALVDLIFKWPSGSDGVLERAAGALANLAADDKCSTEVAAAGGVHALVMLARSCKFEGVQEQAARALANLAAHGESNGNNAAIGQEAGALEALVQLTCSHHEGVRQEAAGALWNLSFDDRNREAIAAVGGVEALVSLARNCSNASQGLQERAAGALWGLSVSEANSIAIGQEGGVAPLIALASSDAEDVHETAAGALWNLAFNAGNAFRIVEEGGVPALVRLCSSSVSKMARFMAALALSYMFDGRMDKYAQAGPYSEGVLKTVSLDGARRMALKQIEAFVFTFSDPQSFYVAASSSTSASLAQVTEAARIPEAGHLRCSGAEIGRFVTMLRHPSSVLKACAAFALLQFTVPGGRHAMYHANLMQKTGAQRVLRASAAAASAPIEAKIFSRIVLRNLEHHFGEVAI
ncbi:Protein ARABIDILLO 1 [Ranunculus cassubicifolius]